MNSQECELAYRKLVVMLDNRKLGWVIEQMNTAIQAGDIELPDKGRSPTVVENFSAQKKLRYLVDAIEQAIVNTVEMEREVSNFFTNEVAFYPDNEDSQASFVINQNTLNERRQESATYLRELLTNLKTRIVEDGSK